MLLRPFNHMLLISSVLITSWYCPAQAFNSTFSKIDVPISIGSEASESVRQIECSRDNFELYIQIGISNNENTWVRWQLGTEDKNEMKWVPELSGTGPWQKEQQSQDAFSSYDENTAISFKNNKVVLVFDNDKAVLFFCK